MTGCFGRSYTIAGSHVPTAKTITHRRWTQPDHLATPGASRPARGNQEAAGDRFRFLSWPELMNGSAIGRHQPLPGRTSASPRQESPRARLADRRLLDADRLPEEVPSISPALVAPRRSSPPIPSPVDREVSSA